jgi:hypothetical protein
MRLFWPSIQKLANLMNLSADVSTSNQVRAIASQQLADLKEWIGKAATAPSDHNQHAHLLFAADQIERFQKDPHKVDFTLPAAPPDGPPIGTFEEGFENELVGSLP